jgi:AbrB family looped-hinge helix DNA binding protein
MALVTVKNKYQVVIPQSVRKQLGIEEGDLLEAKVERGKLTYTRKTLIDRIPDAPAERARFFRQLRAEAPAWLKEIWAASKHHGTNRLTAREIEAIISAAREQRPGTKRTGRRTTA